MTLRHLNIFKTVCECKSITAAADKLYMTQPAVSIAIKELESYYDVQLFIRANRKIYLTPEGEVLFAHATAIMDQFMATSDLLHDTNNFNKINLGVNVVTSEAYMGDLIKRVRAAGDDVLINYTIKSSGLLEQMVLDNELDFAIIDLVSAPKKLVKQKLYQCDMILICNPKYYSEKTITIEELSRKRMYLQEQGTGSRLCIDSAFRSRGLTPIVKAETNSTLSLVELARIGNGFSVVSSDTARSFAYDPSLHVVKIVGVSLTRHYFIVYNCNRVLTPQMERFLSEISVDSATST